MKPQLYAIIDDRERLPQDLQRLVGDIHFGDLLRRRRRYIDELHRACAGATDVIILRSDAETERLQRQIEGARGDHLWLRLPTMIAPLNLDRLDFVIRKMQYALGSMRLGPVMEDDAPMVLTPRDALAVFAASAGKERRSLILQLGNDAEQLAEPLACVDLRNTDALRGFLSGATEPRAFNQFSAEPGIFTKSSSNIDKMRAEHGFFEIASSEMRRFLLPTFGYSEKGDRASYKMEHLQVPDAALQFVLGTFSEAHFDLLLDQFFAFIGARSKEHQERSSVRMTGHAQIVEKLHARLEAFLAMPVGRRVNSYLDAAGLSGGIADMQARSEALITQVLDTSALDYLAVSHGDPCLSNILFDGRTGLFRLIDPRGATTRQDALMHPLYDLAKFSHSICGGYDFVNNGLFSIEVTEDLGLELNRHRGGTPAWMKDRFRERLAGEGWSYAHVRAVETSLFLSMLPLHLDHERKLIAFALIAEEILNELEGNRMDG